MYATAVCGSTCLHAVLTDWEDSSTPCKLRLLALCGPCHQLMLAVVLDAILHYGRHAAGL